MEKIIKKLYEENIDSIYRFAYFKMQSNKEEVYNIIQESFYKLIKELEKKKKIENLKAYIYRIVNNKIIDYYKKNKNISLDENIDNLWYKIKDKNDIENNLDAKIQVEKIYHIIKWFNDDEKNMFLLRFVEELNPKEIAKIYKKDVNSITVKLHRLKTKVVEKLKYYK